MPGQLDNINFNGNKVSATLSTFTITLPNMIQLQKIDDHTVQATLNISPLLPKWIPPVIGSLLGLRLVQWNLDTGSISVR